MIALQRQQVLMAIEADGVQLRKQAVGDMSVGFVSARKGIGLRPALEGLPQDL
jgi:hypothetical protein